jgi:hypothetical protein
MAVDLEDDELELDEQGNPKPKPQAPPPQAIGTPIQPTTGVSGSPAPGKFQDVSPIMPKPQPWEAPESRAISPISPDAAPQAAPAGAGSLGAPINPYVPAPRPAAERAAHLAANPPEYHGFNKFLDILGRVTGPGRAIESLGGYGTLGYDTKLGRADTQAQAEERQIEGGEKERQAKATLEETQARTGKEEQQTEASKSGMENVMITLPGGQMMSVPKSQLGPDVRAMITEQGAGQRTAATNTSKEGIAAAGNESKEAIAGAKPQPHVITMQNGKPHVMERNPQTKEYSIDRGEAPPNYAATGPQTHTVELLGQDNVMHRFQYNAQTQQFDKDMGPAPTGQAAHQIFQAGAIENLVPQIIQDINDNREVLGKLSSYYKAWLAGTPISDPKAAKMMGELMSLAAMQPALHAFRSTNAMEGFENMIGGLAKDPDATIATINGLMKTPQAFTSMPQGGPHGGGGAEGGEQHDEGTIRTNKRTGEVQTWTKGKWQQTTAPRQ